MKKRFLVGILCWCLLAFTLGTDAAAAPSQAQGSTAFSYTPSKTTQIDREEPTGPGDTAAGGQGGYRPNGSRPVRTGDTRQLGGLLMALSGSGLLILLLLLLRRRQEESEG